MTDTPAVSTRRILSIWLPLAGSWLLMGLEMPAFTAAASRLPGEAVSLAAFNSIVYPVSMVVEGPIVMLLAASTALVVDRVSYRKLRKFTIAAATALTIVHASIAFTPLFDAIARDLIEIADEAVEPARLGLRIMLPWSAAIAYRRFQQGVLIRHGHSRAVVVGTMVRLVTVTGLLALGVGYGGADGVVVGATAIACGVTAEAVYAAWRTRRVVRETLVEHAPSAKELTTGSFLRFYAPLALTPLITLGMQPITAWALWHMPDSLRSSAAWSSVYGFIFLFRALGFAFQEVVLTLWQQPGGPAALRRFALRLAGISTAVFLLIACTPAVNVWFAGILDLQPELTELGGSALAVGALMPLIAVLQHFLQGQLVAAHRTRAITEAVTIYSVIACTLFVLATVVWPVSGIDAALLVLTIAGLSQLGWLWLKSRSAASIIATT